MSSNLRHETTTKLLSIGTDRSEKTVQTWARGYKPSSSSTQLSMKF